MTDKLRLRVCGGGSGFRYLLDRLGSAYPLLFEASRFGVLGIHVLAAGTQHSRHYASFPDFSEAEEYVQKLESASWHASVVYLLPPGHGATCKLGAELVLSISVLRAHCVAESLLKGRFALHPLPSTLNPPDLPKSLK